MAQRKIYYISISFPPEGRGASVIRGYQCLYLLNHGWDVEVVAADAFPCPEQKLINELRSFSNFRIHNFHSAKGLISKANLVLERLGVVGDYEYEWIRNVKKKLQIYPEKDSMIVATTGGSFAELEIGAYLKQRYYLPLVLNFRDPLANTVFDGKQLDWWAVNRDHFERRYMEAADYVITATESMKRVFQEKYPRVKGKISTIYGGYVRNSPYGSLRRKRDSLLHIGYAGGISRNQRPEIIIKALKELDKADRERVQLHFWADKKISSRVNIPAEIRSCVQIHEFRPYEEFFPEFMRIVDVAFLSLYGDYYAHALSSKIFEYINAQKPVLAAGPIGDLKEFIERHKIGLFSDFREPGGLGRQIKKLLDNPEILDNCSQNIQKIKSGFSTQQQTQHMNAVFEKLLKDEIQLKAY